MHTQAIMSNKENNRISKSVTKGGITKTITCKEVENGFVIEIEKYGKESEDGEYISECKTFISKTNPLAEEEKEESKEGKGNEVLDSVASLLSNMGELI